jgi:hypothetical protein
MQNRDNDTAELQWLEDVIGIFLKALFTSVALILRGIGQIVVGILRLR